MAIQVKFVTVPSKTLSASINGSATSIQLSDIKGWDGNDLTSANFGDVLWCVLRDSTNTFMEIMQLDPTTIANSSITVLARGLDFSGGGNVPANQLTWIKNDTIVELGTNPPHLLAQGVMVSGNQTIADLKTFTTLPQCTAVPTNAADMVNKAYVDATTTGNASYNQNILAGIAGENLTKGNVVYLKSSDGKWYVADSATASKSVAVQLGIAQATVSTSAAINVLIGGLDMTQTGLTAGNTYYLSTTGSISTTKGANIRIIGRTPSGSTTNLIVEAFGGDPEKMLVDGSRTYVDDTGSANAYAMTLVPSISAYKKGQMFSFKAANTNSTASTLNVNALGTKNIFYAGAAFSGGEIVAGSVITVVYDGTQFQMISPSGTVLTNSSVLNKFGGTGADGALAISSGTTTIDCQNKKVFVKNYSSIAITGTAKLAFINPHSTGTIIILKSVAGVTVTSSTVPAIDASGMGATSNTSGVGFRVQTSPSTSTATAPAAITLSFALNGWGLTYTDIIPGAGGATGATGPGVGAGTAGAGGLGGGGLYIECGGALNITSTLWSKGLVGGNASAGSTFTGGSGGGGGGCGGTIYIVYSTLTANSGTYLVSGANGGNGSNGGGGGGGGNSGGSGGGGGSFILAGANGGAGPSTGGNPGNNGSSSTDGTGGTGGTATNVDSGGSGGGGGGRGITGVVQVNTN